MENNDIEGRLVSRYLDPISMCAACSVNRQFKKCFDTSSAWRAVFESTYPSTFTHILHTVALQRTTGTEPDWKSSIKYQHGTPFRWLSIKHNRNFVRVCALEKAQDLSFTKPLATFCPNLISNEYGMLFCSTISRKACIWNITQLAIPTPQHVRNTDARILREIHYKTEDPSFLVHTACTNNLLAACSASKLALWRIIQERNEDFPHISTDPVNSTTLRGSVEHNGQSHCSFSGSSENILVFIY